MTTNKTQPNDISVKTFLAGVSEPRQQEARTLIDLMRSITGHAPVMWGPRIIGFGTQQYEYESGREGDMPRLGFSPRKASITIYFSEGFDRYSEELSALGKHKQSVSCLYINTLSDIDLEVLRRMLEQSYALASGPQSKPTSVDEYIASIPVAARPKFDELRQIVTTTLPNADEVLSYGIVGYKLDDKRARVYISGWKDHLAIYPVPADETLQADLKPYIKGKGTLWFSLDDPLPTQIITRTVQALAT